MATFSVDPNRKEPLYQQLAAQLRAAIYAGDLAPGTKLPKEIEMSASCGVSVGTVRAAYQALCREQVLLSVQGSGYYVISEPADRCSQESVQYISALLDQLISIPDLSVQEIFALCKRRFREKARKDLCVRLLWIDCTPEVMFTVAEQLRTLSNVSVDTFSTKDFMARSQELLPRYDFAISSPRHVDELYPFFLNSSCRLEKLDFTLKKETALEAIRIPKGSTVAILSRSERYFRYVKSSLCEFEQISQFISCFYHDFLAQVCTFLPGQVTLVLPADYPDHIDQEMIESINHFAELGGQTFLFFPEIDQGSLLALEEKIVRFRQERQSLATGGSSDSHKQSSS